MFLHYIGNWKKSKRQDTKDIYKCHECEVKLEVEKKGIIYKVKILNGGEPHNWCDNKHVDAFKRGLDSPNKLDSSIKMNIDKIHMSIECFVKQQIKTGVSISPEVILENLKKERPQLYKNFRPSQDQLTYFIYST